jgi:O-antigen/teichoic acid export membrane protein
MSSVETTSSLAEKASVASDSRKTEWKPSDVVQDIATLGTGTLLAGLVNIALVFVVPKIISVEDYGYWRMFALYAGYVGFLHFGFADGALLRWAGRPLDQFHAEIAPSLKYLLLQQFLVLAPLCLIGWLMLSGPLRFVALAVAVYALILNATTLLQYALQGAKIFRPVAISTVVAPALFLAAVLLWRTRWQANFQVVMLLFACGWLLALLFLLASSKPWRGSRFAPGWTELAKSCVSSGWPIVMTNMGAMLIICEDRLAVSWAANIRDFAQYSLAASAIAVPVMAIQACSKVFFSHLASVTPEGRRRIYGLSSRLLLMAWAFLLPYYFALDVFVRHFLPRYTPALQYALILLLGIPFLATIQILQMSYAYLHGLQRRFLAGTVSFLVVALGAISLTAFRVGSLRVVAALQVTVLALWWLFNEWTARELTSENVRTWAKFGAIYALSSLGFLASTSLLESMPVSVLGYYAYLVVLTALLCRDELRVCAKALPGFNRMEPR